jgi:hypothetical protein
LNLRLRPIASANKEAMLPPTASSDEAPSPPVDSPTLSSIDETNAKKKRSADRQISRHDDDGDDDDAGDDSGEGTGATIDYFPRTLCRADGDDGTEGTFAVASQEVMKERKILKVTTRSADGQLDPGSAEDPSASINLMGGTSGTSTKSSSNYSVSWTGLSATAATSSSETKSKEGAGTITPPFQFGSKSASLPVPSAPTDNSTSTKPRFSFGAAPTASTDSASNLSAPSPAFIFGSTPAPSAPETPVKESSTKEGEKKRKLLHSPTQQPEEGKADTQGVEEATSEDATAVEEHQQRALNGLVALEGHTQPLAQEVLALLERSRQRKHEVTQSKMQGLRDANQAYTQGLRDVMQGLHDANQTYMQGMQGLQEATSTDSLALYGAGGKCE